MGQFIDFRYVKQHARFEPVLARYGIELAGRGEERKALCPFHEESDPSFKYPRNWDRVRPHTWGDTHDGGPRPRRG